MSADAFQLKGLQMIGALVRRCWEGSNQPHSSVCMGTSLAGTLCYVMLCFIPPCCTYVLCCIAMCCAVLSRTAQCTCHDAGAGADVSQPPCQSPAWQHPALQVKPSPSAPLRSEPALCFVVLIYAVLCCCAVMFLQGLISASRLADCQPGNITPPLQVNPHTDGASLL